MSREGQHQSPADGPADGTEKPSAKGTKKAKSKAFGSKKSKSRLDFDLVASAGADATVDAETRPMATE